jgi:HEAT repeat protein
MRKGKRILLLAACLLLAAALAGLLIPDSEPRYHGRSLSKWLALYSPTRDPSDFDEAEKAIRAIGTNALPYLLKWIRQEPPFWQRAAFNTFPTSIRGSPQARALLYGPGSERAAAALAALCLLGTNAAAAIPELAAMMKDTAHPWTALRAMTAISYLGAPAFPHMTAALSTTNYPYRVAAAFYLAQSMAPLVGTNACLPPLIAALNDPDPQVRTAASIALGYLTNAPAH